MVGEAALPPLSQPGRVTTNIVSAGTTECSYFNSGRCRSCTLLEIPYTAQIDRKLADAHALLAAWPDAEWLDPVLSQPLEFRNRAKMVVGGTAEAPSLGILDPSQHGIDLTGCVILKPELRAAFPSIKTFITQAHLTPYDVPNRRGELKHVLLTQSADGAMMLRFVLRSTEPLGRIRKHLPSLLAELPQLSVVSVNLLPQHKAVIEGDEEIMLVGETLPMRLGDTRLHLLPASFFQTNTEIAASLYEQARQWLDEVDARSVWDLYCGVGGFALHAAAPGRQVHGIELSEPAIASARRSAAEAGLEDVSFSVGDATALIADNPPEAIIVNPPRRGLGDALCATLDGSGVPTIIYSSCNAQTLARDLTAMPAYRPKRIRPFDMFPQTEHYEIMVLLTLTSKNT